MAEDAFLEEKLFENKYGIWKYSEDGIITKFEPKDGVTKILVPPEIEGIKIYGIGRKAFCKNRVLEEVTISDGIKSIGDKAFKYCVDLKSVTIPNSVESIGAFAFKNCISLKLIKIPEGVEFIGACAFESCVNLDLIVIPDSVKFIDDYAFGHCTNLKSITISSSIKFIGIYAFEDCVNLESVTVKPSNNFVVLKKGPRNMFKGCKSLALINISHINQIEMVKLLFSRSEDFFYAHKPIEVRLPDGRQTVINCKEDIEYLSENSFKENLPESIPLLVSVNKVKEH